MRSSFLGFDKKGLLEKKPWVLILLHETRENQIRRSSLNAWLVQVIYGFTIIFFPSISKCTAFVNSSNFNTRETLLNLEIVALKCTVGTGPE